MTAPFASAIAATGNTASGQWGAVVAGAANNASGTESLVAGGVDNPASGTFGRSQEGASWQNKTLRLFSTVSGGEHDVHPVTARGLNT
jgi:hypothetical protein